MSLRIVVYFAAAWAMFLAASATPFLLGIAGLEPFLESVPWLRHFIIKTVLVALAFAAMSLDGRPLARFGFRRALPWRRVLLLAGLGVGLVATLLVFVTPARGMTEMFAGFGFVAVVLSIWIYSSVTEEIFTRGWYQTAVSADGESGAASDRAPVFASAILFGSMHLSLVWAGADLWTVAIIVTFTTLLGLAAAVARRQSGSLMPAIWVHVLFNVGGFIAGVVYTIITIAQTGKPPVL